jgi:carboxyl-terminal processing protease
MAKIMKQKVKLLITLLCLAWSSITISAPQPTPTPAPIPTPTSTVALPTPAADEKLPITDLDRFTTVIEHIKNYYVKPVDDSALFEGAIRGMLAGLDPHSAYLDKEEFADLKASTSGKFGGLGIEVTLDDGLIKVISPLDGSPAAKAGVLAGDLIVRIDDTAVKDLSLRDAVERMRGKAGTDVYLTVLRQGETKPLKLKLTREIINVQSVHSKMVDNGYAYVRISQFQNETGTELAKELKSLLAKSNGKLKGLILDLRNNPGGVLDASVQTASAFLDKDKIGYDKVVVFTKGRLASSQIKEKATGKDMLSGTPIVVLVNGGSASAAEIVAGALQDHKRAVIVGTKTFGKASVQTVLPLKDQRGLKLTTALYYTPAGTSIQARGIIPDIVVENVNIPKPKPASSTEGDLAIHEADLEGHLETKPETDAVAKVPGKDDASMYSDYQLYEALNVLKAQQALNKAK